jgi:2-polyprenyl-3-methyl-5-hydroxy-6-metoxy-1,4-benzoquinol methylase
MSTHPNEPWSNYDRHSDYFFHTYNKIQFSRIHKPFIRFLPKKMAAKVLDIGCGSGRDAMALAKRGYTVTAVDPSREMLRLAEKQDTKKRITWIRDALPQLRTLGNKSYSFILISAVWMHVPPSQRDSSIKRITELLAKDGRLAITLRMGEQDEGRAMYPITLEELLTLATQYGLHPIYISRATKDSLNRGSISWKKIVFSK